MEIGIGLPATIPGATGEQIVEWATTAEARGFSSLGVVDRLVYDNYEPLVTLPFAGRGRRFDDMLGEMTRIWAGEPRGFAGSIGPSPGLDRTQLVFGGMSRATYRRVAILGGGWIAGSRGVETFHEGATHVRQAWAEHGRSGAPRLMALPYFCLGPRAEANAVAFLTDHYAIEGDAAKRMAATALTDAGSIQRAVSEYEAAGCDELILYPCSPDPQQVSLLADVVRTAV